MSVLRWIIGAGLFAAPALAQNFEEANTQRWGADYMRIAMAQQTAEDCARRLRLRRPLPFLDIRQGRG